MTAVADAYRRAGRRLAAAGVPQPRQEALYLLGRLLETDGALMLARKDATLERGQVRRYRRWVQQRGRGLPLAYICGRTEFYSRSFAVRPGVFVPRCETEILVEQAAELLTGEAVPPGPVVDLGTGSGVIAVTLALEVSRRSVWAIDCSAAALDLARHNAVRHGVSQRVRFFHGDFWQAVACDSGDDRCSPPAVVVSNPPYVADPAALAPAVRRHEPAAALLAEDEGMACHHAVVAGAERRLAPGGGLLLEMAPQQADPLTEWLQSRDCWSQPQVTEDLAGRPRVIEASLRERPGVLEDESAAAGHSL